MHILLKGWKVAFLVLALCILGNLSAQAQDVAHEVVVLKAGGPVAPTMANYITRGLEEADERNAEAAIIMLDTPGGSVSVTMDIVQTIRNSDVPVIVFVGPRGAKAASAGLLITLAGHAAVMAPDTAIGASSPVGAQGEDLGETIQQKEEQYLGAQGRSLAERRGADAIALTEEAVFDARAVTAREALEANLIDLVVENPDELLDQIDGFKVEVNGKPRTIQTKGASLFHIDMTLLEQILSVLTDPNIVFVLMSLGTTLIIIEAWSPGGWAAGAAGVVCLGLAFYGIGVLPVNWLGIIFIILAFVLFLLEVKTPTHGALTIAAIASLSAGAFILFGQPQMAPFGTLSIPLVIGWSVLLGGIFFFMVMMAIRAQKRRPTTGSEGLIGEIGRVTQDLTPEGKILIWGERWQAEAIDEQSIPVGSDVEVVEVRGMWLRVRRKERNLQSPSATQDSAE
ncbi:MAG: nodulation protein NfeD [Anaerolineae bacterium]|nr:nodulation protein NfeD [Anaerolineae bacterium]